VARSGWGLEPLQAAKLHALESGIQVDFACRKPWKSISETCRAKEQDVVTCMEMEHVPDPQSVVRACAQLVKPGGDVFSRHLTAPQVKAGWRWWNIFMHGAQKARMM